MTLKILKNWLNFFLQWCSQHLVEISVYLIPLVLTMLCIEAVRSSGYLQKFGIYTAFWIAVSLAFECLVFLRQNQLSSERHKILDTVNVIIRFLTISFTVVTTLVIITQINNEPGSNTILLGQVLNLPSLITITAYLFGLILISFFAPLLESLPKYFLFLFVVFFFIVFRNFPLFSNVLLERLNRAYELAFTSEREKMNWLWDEMYPLSDVVNREISSSSSILLPPQKYPWPVTGNQFVMRRFVHPRILISFEDWNQSFDNIDVVLSDDGGTYTQYYSSEIGWPQVPVSTENIILAVPWKKELTVSGLTINNQRQKIDWSLQTNQLVGTASATKHLDTVALTLEFEAFSSTTSAQLLSPPVFIEDDDVIQVRVEKATDLAISPFIEYQINNLSKKLYYGVLRSEPEKENTVVFDDLIDRINEAEGQSVNQIKVGFDLAYQPPLPYLYGKSLLLVKHTPPSEDCSTSAESCQWYINNLLATNQLYRALQILEQVRVYYGLQPWYMFYQYLVNQELNIESTQQSLLLEKLSRAWSMESYNNLPQHLLEEREMDTP